MKITSGPSERYPFTYSRRARSVQRSKTDSILKRPESDPLVMHTHTEQRVLAAPWLARPHGPAATASDLELPDAARMYFVHRRPARPAARPPGSEASASSPPNSRTIADPARLPDAAGPLGDRRHAPAAEPSAAARGRHARTPEDVLARFPRIPGVNLPPGPSRLPLYNYGPDFDRGIMSDLPPTPTPGKEYPVQVPQIDADGNERAGLRSPDVAVPLGTYTGWALRKPGFAEGDMLS